MNNNNYFLEIVDFYHTVQANRESVNALGNSIQSLENKLKLVVDSINKNNTSKINDNLFKGLKETSKVFFNKNRSLFPYGLPAFALSLEKPSLKYDDIKTSFLKNMPGYDSDDDNEEDDYLSIINPSSEFLCHLLFNKSRGASLNAIKNAHISLLVLRFLMGFAHGDCIEII